MEKETRNNLIVAVAIVVLLSVLGGLTFVEGLRHPILAVVFLVLGASSFAIWKKRDCFIK